MQPYKAGTTMKRHRDPQQGGVRGDDPPCTDTHPPHPLPSGKQSKSHNILQSNPNQNQSPKSTQAQRSTPKESWQH